MCQKAPGLCPKCTADSVGGRAQTTDAPGLKCFPLTPAISKRPSQQPRLHGALSLLSDWRPQFPFSFVPREMGYARSGPERSEWEPVSQLRSRRGEKPAGVQVGGCWAVCPRQVLPLPGGGPSESPQSGLRGRGQAVALSRRRPGHDTWLGLRLTSPGALWGLPGRQPTG